MNTLTKDPLLGIARILLAILIGLVLFAFVGLIIGLGAVMTVQRAEILSQIAEAGAPAGVIWGILLVLALITAVLFLAYRFLRELYTIVTSVDQGDPFQPSNADRLARMGWIALGTQLLGLAIMIIVEIVAKYVPEVSPAGTDFGISGGGILLTLTLFILARVFRKGTEMREELEGTV